MTNTNGEQTALYIIKGSIERNGTLWLGMRKYNHMKLTEKTVSGYGKRFKLCDMFKVLPGAIPENWEVRVTQENEVPQAQAKMIAFLERALLKRIAQAKEQIRQMEDTLATRNYTWAKTDVYDE